MYRYKATKYNIKGCYDYIITNTKIKIPNECPMRKIKFQKFDIRALKFIYHLNYLICHYKTLFINVL